MQGTDRGRFLSIIVEESQMRKSWQRLFLEDRWWCFLKTQVQQIHLWLLHIVWVTTIAEMKILEILYLSSANTRMDFLPSQWYGFCSLARLLNWNIVKQTFTLLHFGSEVLFCWILLGTIWILFSGLQDVIQVGITMSMCFTCIPRAWRLACYQIAKAHV